MHIEQLIKANEIRILSGEGESGTSAQYTGARTMRAIQSKLAKERCNGDRWVKALVYSHDSDAGLVFINIETGELCHQKRNAGRPTEMDGGKRVQVYLDAASLNRAAELGGGNVSEGIRISLKI